MATEVLQYQKARRTRRRGALIAAAVVVTAIALYMSRGKLTSAYEQIAYVRLQSRCVNTWTSTNFVAFSEADDEVAALLASSPSSYGEAQMSYSDGCSIGFKKPTIPNAAYLSADFARLLESPSKVVTGTVFVGRRTTSGGKERLVYLPLIVGDETIGGHRRLILCGVAWQPASYSLGSRVTHVGVGNKFLQVKKAARVRIMSGRVDPHREDAVTVELFADAEKWTLEARVVDDDEEPIVWRIVEGSPEIFERP